MTDHYQTATVATGVMRVRKFLRILWWIDVAAFVLAYILMAITVQGGGEPAGSALLAVLSVFAGFWILLARIVMKFTGWIVTA